MMESESIIPIWVTGDNVFLIEYVIGDAQKSFEKQTGDTAKHPRGFVTE